MNPTGLQLLARFSLPPNRLGYCGDENINPALIRCINHGEADPVLLKLPSFKSQLPYLKTIAEVTGLDYLDYQVVEAYWLGNDLLNQFKSDHYQIFLKHLNSLNLPDFYLHSMSLKQPEFFIPFHLYSVHLAVPMKISPPIQHQIDQCMISWGKVTPKTISENHYYPECDPDIKVGDLAAFHWNSVVKILTLEEVENLKYWTHKVMTLADSG
jgi:hypothetical protein